MSIFANNKHLAISCLRAAGTGETLLAALEAIAQDVKQTEAA